MPNRQVGIIPGWSGTQRLVRRVGGPVVKRLVLTGQDLARARALATDIAERAPVAVELAKLLVNLAEGEEMAAAAEAIAGALALSTADAREGVAAFRAKRRPVFRGS
jgi:enoyl-CoA hydratase/carnithine racemase